MRMMKTFLTESVFQKGLINCLNKHRYDVITADGFWNEMATAANADSISSHPLTIKTIMDSWTLQEGYPCIEVKIDYLNKIAKLTQVRLDIENIILVFTHLMLCLLFIGEIYIRRIT